ncbi:cell division protein FtsQ/DivIB [Actinomyces culturomici]|uniref:cell division protein FtsQ/DivIB n=1 Tax=Actinomyces culturomici TaxID=1926276 RepID=UPI00135B4AB2|nr:cell division protein FtsQ/DivIB [Actinomyces culturomici]
MKPPAPRRPSAPEPDRRGRSARADTAGNSGAGSAGSSRGSGGSVARAANSESETPVAGTRGARAASSSPETPLAGEPAPNGRGRRTGPLRPPSPVRPGRGARAELSRPVGQADAASILGSRDAAPATDFAARRAERDRAKRAFYARTGFIVVAGIALVAAIVWALLFSPLLALDANRITVTGAQDGVISASEATAAATPYVGTPLPRVPTSSIAAAIEKNPVVAGAAVTRRWPAGLGIALTLREAAMVEGSQGAYRLVDSGGVAFRTVAELPDGLPVVSLPAEEGRAEAAADALAVWNALGKVLQPQVALVSADGKTLTLSLTNGATVKWGTNEDSALKAKVLEVLVAQRGASVYDVSAPAHPVTS